MELAITARADKPQLETKIVNLGNLLKENAEKSKVLSGFKKSTIFFKNVV